ncbi:MAG: hypothetical protein HON19_06205 [Flavobacteriales bacterium]|nr:hypothetical protein [Flavobacteriales bacterium]
MCIVSYIPHASGFSFTSNRDEQIDRSTREPAFYSTGKTKLLYPKDLNMGGTWFAVDPKNKKACCLLNVKPIPNSPPPKLSRGRLPIKVLLDSKSVCQKKALEDTAPFFLIQLNYENQKIKITSIIWNGSKVKEHLLNPKKPHLWCSTSLYSPQSNDTFQKLFKKTLPDLKSPEKILNFHKDVAQPLNSDRFLRKNKNLQTVSITSLTECSKKCHLTYIDLVQDSKTSTLALSS